MVIILCRKTENAWCSSFFTIGDEALALKSNQDHLKGQVGCKRGIARPRFKVQLPTASGRPSYTGRLIFRPILLFCVDTSRVAALVVSFKFQMNQWLHLQCKHAQLSLCSMTNEEARLADVRRSALADSKRSLR